MARYFPYETIASLRGRRELGQASPGPLSFPTQQAIEAYRPMTHREAAKELGLKLPAVPQLSKKALDAWSIMEGMEIVAARLNRTFLLLQEMLVRGAVRCEDLKLYNQTALDLYEMQQKQIEVMKGVGIFGVPDEPPFPTLFIGKGRLGSVVRGRLECENDEIVGPGQVAPSFECMPQLENPVLLGLAVAVVVFGLPAMTNVAENWKDVEIERERTLQGEKKAEWLQRRLELIQAFVRDCRKEGKLTYEQCLREGHRLLPEKVLPPAAPSKRGWLWWIGLGTVLAVAGGGLVLYVQRRG